MQTSNAEGFAGTAVQTGGGCSALKFDLPGGLAAYIADEDTSAPDESTADVSVTIFDESNGDILFESEENIATAKEAIAGVVEARARLQSIDGAKDRAALVALHVEIVGYDCDEDAGDDERMSDDELRAHLVEMTLRHAAQDGR